MLITSSAAPVRLLPKATLNLGHSAARGLEKLWLPAHKLALGAGESRLSNTGTPTLAYADQVVGVSGWDASTYLNDAAFKLGPVSDEPFSILVVARRLGSVSTNTAIAGKKDFSSGGSGNGRGFQISVASANGGDFRVQFRGQRIFLYDYLTSPSPAWLTVVGKRYCLVLTANKGTTSGIIYLNGRDVSTSWNNPGGVSDWDPQSIVPVGIGVAWDEGNLLPQSTNLVIEAVGVWPTRQLTASEARALSLNPWQLLSPAPRRIWSSAGGGSNSYTLSVSGGVTFSGTIPLRRERKQVPSGGINFSGATPLLRTRAQIPSGGVTFGGTAPIIFNAPNIYTILPSGGVAFSGAVSLRRQRLFSPSGAVSFSGAAPLIRTRVTVPSGRVTLSGSAPIVFIPAGGMPFVPTNRINVGSSRSNRIS